MKKFRLIFRYNENGWLVGINNNEYTKNTKIQFVTFFGYCTEKEAINFAEKCSKQENLLFDLNHCKFCGSELVFDKLSKKYGDYCPNISCDYLN